MVLLQKLRGADSHRLVVSFQRAHNAYTQVLASYCRRLRHLSETYVLYERHMNCKSNSALPSLQITITTANEISFFRLISAELYLSALLSAAASETLAQTLAAVPLAGDTASRYVRRVAAASAGRNVLNQKTTTETDIFMKQASESKLFSRVWD